MKVTYLNEEKLPPKLPVSTESLDTEERYDPKMDKIWSFKHVDDIVEGMVLNLGNMLSSYPFEVDGVRWRSSEELYLSGEFSHAAEEHRMVQEALRAAKSPYAAKRFIKAKYRNLVRKDFPEFRTQWMLWCVWQKSISSAARAISDNFLDMKERFVRLTKRKIEEIFDACNKAYFNNEVEKPVCFELWTPNINIIGMVRPVWNVKKKVFFSALHISNQYKWTEKDLTETILHEMIHLYIKDYIHPQRWWHFFFPPKQHAKEFKRVMADLNEKYGLNIVIKAPHMKQYRKMA